MSIDLSRKIIRIDLAPAGNGLPIKQTFLLLFFIHGHQNSHCAKGNTKCMDQKCFLEY